MAVASSIWQRRIERAQQLSGQHPFAEEILRFYVHVAGFQQDLQLCVGTQRPSTEAEIDRALAESELAELTSRFASFLSLAEEHGPQQLCALGKDLRARGPVFWSELLNATWSAERASDAQAILALIVLQPYAELLQSRASKRPSLNTYAVCPFCQRKPCVGVMRPLGDGAARSLVCSFCVNEWEFRRIVCPGCGEEDDKKLPVYTASDFEYIRVECCESCKTYIKTGPDEERPRRPARR